MCKSLVSASAQREREEDGVLEQSAGALLFSGLTREKKTNWWRKHTIAEVRRHRRLREAGRSYNVGTDKRVGSSLLEA